MKLSIYDRIGGSAGVQAVVEALYNRLMLDPEMARFFEGVDMVHMKRRQRLFMSQLLGGPALAEMPDMAVAHARAVHVHGLDDAVFDRFIDHLRTGLADLNASPLVTNEIVATLERLRGDVLGKGAHKRAA
jgi:hemoglobin